MQVWGYWPGSAEVAACFCLVWHCVQAGSESNNCLFYLVVVFLASTFIEVLRELFSAKPISLRAAASKKSKLLGSDFQFNLVQSFAASGRYQTGHQSEFFVPFNE
ncbi:hypothetical protein YC2023_107231 [Brassica napus]